MTREEPLAWTNRTGDAGARLRHIGVTVALATVVAGCDRASSSHTSAVLADEPSPVFRNIATATSYVGDATCTPCHAAEAEAYRQHAMARSFHRWTPADQMEAPLDSGIVHTPTGLVYTVVEDDGQLFQVEYVPGPEGRRLHELRRRIDWVTGSGAVARTYFTEENGRLFQLPLTWYRRQGWDFSPGYQLNNARFDRSLPDRCVACHSSYPEPLPFLEGKYAELRPGIGCERCHGPGALHVQERSPSTRSDSGSDNSIVNPARLPLARRMDVCEQCHVHTTVSVLREGKDAFSFLPSQTLHDHWAFFKVAGSIDIVSHADRLRQSACFLATRTTPTPLECATCHNPHQPPSDGARRNQPCQTCHSPDALRTKLARSSSLAEHAPSADCASCHMPRTGERGVPHGTFTDHWIRVASRNASSPNARRQAAGPIEPYFDRDKAGPEAEIYRGMGGVMYATLANDARTLANAAASLDRTLGADTADTARGEALFLLGVAYEQLGKTADAIRVLERAVRSDPAHPDRLRALAHAYRITGRPPADVERLYRRALTLQPALAWIRADYADFLQSRGRRDEAVVAYRDALTEQPSLTAAWFNLGTTYSEAGRMDEATNAFRRAVQLDPSLGEALSTLIEVQTRGTVAARARALAPPLPSLPVRERGPRAIRLSVASEPSVTGLRIVNVPPRSLVRILDAGGSLVRALPPINGWSHTWDLRTAGGALTPSGLYRVQVEGRDPTGRPFAPQVLPFGIVRQRLE